MLRLALDYLKTKKMCKHAIKKLPFIIKYVPDLYKTQGMCNKDILENNRMLTTRSPQDSKPVWQRC